MLGRAVIKEHDMTVEMSEEVKEVIISAIEGNSLAGVNVEVILYNYYLIV